MPPKRKRKPVKKAKPTELNDRQERFARAYAASFDAEAAFKEAGYKLATKNAVRDAKARLLANPAVLAVVDEVVSAAAAKYGLDAEGVIARLKLAYLEACKDRQWAAAVSALKELGKVFGIYAEHNKQKKYTPEDIDRLRSELGAAGFDLSVLNKPSPN